MKKKKPDFKEHPENYEMISQEVDYETGQQTAHIKRKGEKLPKLNPDQEEKFNLLTDSVLLICKECEALLNLFTKDDEIAEFKLMILKKHIDATLEDFKKKDPENHETMETLSNALQIVAQVDLPDVKKKMEGKNGK